MDLLVKTVCLDYQINICVFSHYNLNQNQKGLSRGWGWSLSQEPSHCTDWEFMPRTQGLCRILEDHHGSIRDGLLHYFSLFLTGNKLTVFIWKSSAFGSVHYFRPDKFFLFFF